MDTPNPRRRSSLLEKAPVHRRLARAVTLDWQVLADDAPAGEGAGRPQPVATPAGRSSRGLRVAAALSLILAAGAGLYLWWAGENGARLLEAELHSAVAAEAWRAVQPAATVQVQGITYHGDVAGVVVKTTHVEGYLQYRCGNIR